MVPLDPGDGLEAPEPSMKLGTFLLLDVLVVGGGILIYDAVRSERPEPKAPEVASISRTGDAPPPIESRPESPIVLSGGGEAALLARLDELGRRIAVLEQTRPAPRAPSTDETTPGGVPGGNVQYPEGADLSLPDIANPEDPRFDPVVLARFRAYVEKVEQMRRDERAAEFVGNQIDRLGLSLTAPQKEQIVAATLKYQAQARETFRNMPRGDPGREERQRAFTELRDQYSKTVNSVVGSADAEKIVASLARWGGGFGDDGRNPRVPRGTGASPEAQPPR
jgi:hypothetical protein